MSASREKKIRQDKVEERNEKRTQAQKQQAQSKRKSVLYTVAGVVCAVLVAALLLWNSGVFQSRAAAVSIGGKTYSAADVQYYYSQVLNQYYMYAQYGIDNGFEPGVDPADQMYDEEKGITWREQIMQEAIDAMTEVKSLAMLAQADGVELSETGAQAVEETMKDLVATSASNGFSTVNSYLKAAFGRSMNKARYEKTLRETELAYEYQAAYAEKLEYSEEKLEEYYTENQDDLDLFYYNYVQIEAVDAEDAEDAEEDAALKAAHDKAHAIEEALLGSADIQELAETYEGDESITVNQDQESVGLYLDSAYADWMKEEGRKAGDVTAAAKSDGTGYVVVEYLGRGRDEEISGDVRHILVAAEQDEGATVPTEEQYEAAKAKAEELLAQWEKGEATEESFAELAKKESADPGSAAQGGLYEMVNSGSGFIAEFADWAIDPERKAGDTGLVKNTASSTKGWHIMYFVGQNDPVWKIGVRNSLIQEDVTNWTDTLIQETEVEKLDGLKNVK